MLSRAALSLLFACCVAGNTADANTHDAGRARCGDSTCPPQATNDATPGPTDTGIAAQLDLWTYDFGELVTAAAPTPPPTTPPVRAQTSRMAVDLAPVAAPSRALHYQSLIHKQGERSTTVAAWDLGGHTELKGFSAQPKASPSNPQQTLRRNDDYRMQGVVAEHDLALFADDTLTLVGGWVSGDMQDGLSSPESRTRDAGSAWSLAGNAKLLSERLGLSLEYAGSDPGAGNASGTAQVSGGQAYKGSLKYAGAPHGMQWSVGTEYAWVDPQFHSLANPGVAADREQLRFFGAIRFDRLACDLALRRQRDNLDRQKASTQFRHQASLTTAWTPQAVPLSAFFGRPTLKVTADVGRQWQRQVADDSETPVEHSSKLKLQSQFNYGYAQWGLSAQAGQIPGAIDAAEAEGIHTAQVDLFGDFALDGSIPLKPKLSWQQKRDQATGATDSKWRAELKSPGFGLDERLHAELGVDFKQQLRNDDNQRNAGLRVGGNLVWTVQRATPSRRGLAVALSGAWLGGERDLIAKDGEGDFRVTLSLSTALPFAN